MPFDHKAYFDSVRQSLFSGHLGQDQVDGQEAILEAWERFVDDQDIRWLAYMLATTYHETSQEMQPIEEYGKGAGQPYGEEDPETGQSYYGRGFVQLTWRENYARADSECGWVGTDSCEWHAEHALDLQKAARIMYLGMTEGWFRGDKLADYFNKTVNDPYGAREIINGDKDVVPSWSGEASIGDLIAGYHNRFLEALEAARIEDPPAPDSGTVSVSVTVPQGIPVVIFVNGEER